MRDRTREKLLYTALVIVVLCLVAQTAYHVITGR